MSASIENLVVVSDSSVTTNGNSSTNRMEGGTGSVEFDGGSGNDTMITGSGDSTFLGGFRGER